MIIVDTNVVVALLVPGDATELAERLLNFDDRWFAPPLCRSEFLQVFVQELKRGKLGPSEILPTLISFARVVELLPAPTLESVVSLALKTGCSAYDCEFVATAELMKCRLATFDRMVYERFPSVAAHPSRLMADE